MEISDLRKKIDKIDNKLTKLFIERMDIAADIAAYKLEIGMNIRDRKREKELVDGLCAKAGDIYAPYISALYSQILEMSRRYQSHIQIANSIEYGLIGSDVGNSYAKWIHHATGNSSFGLYSIPKEILPLLFKKRAFKGICVATPYKHEAAVYCDKLDATASVTGYVNTVIREENGKLSGFNTEYDGILAATKRSGIDFNNKRILLFGNGSISSSVQQVLHACNAAEIIIVTRTGKINFRNYTQYKDVDMVINATNVGMEPDSEISPAELSLFSNLCGVVDCVYTPAETLFISEAKKLNIPYTDGLSIMIAHSVKSSELFGFKPEDGICDELYEELLSFIQ